MRFGTWRDGLRPIVRFVSKVLLLGLAAPGAFLGLLAGERLAPHNDAVTYGGAVAGIVVAVLIWWPIDKLLRQLAPPPETTPASSGRT